MLHKRIPNNENTIQSKEGQRGLLCSNKVVNRCPSLDYKYVENTENNVDKAFDVLFQEINKIIGINSND